MFSVIVLIFLSVSVAYKDSFSRPESKYEAPGAKRSEEDVSHLDIRTSARQLNNKKRNDPSLQGRQKTENNNESETYQVLDHRLETLFRNEELREHSVNGTVRGEYISKATCCTCRCGILEFLSSCVIILLRFLS